MKKIILKIGGMTCSACSSGLEKYLNKQDGIISASVNLVMANALIEYDETKVDRKMLDTFVKKAGFKSLGEFKEIKIEGKNKKEKVKFIIFTILAIVFMYIAMGHMINLPIFSFIDVNQNPIGYTICLFVFAILFITFSFIIILIVDSCYIIFKLEAWVRVIEIVLFPIISALLASKIAFGNTKILLNKEKNIKRQFLISKIIAFAVSYFMFTLSLNIVVIIVYLVMCIICSVIANKKLEKALKNSNISVKQNNDVINNEEM